MSDFDEHNFDAMRWLQNEIRTAEHHSGREATPEQVGIGFQRLDPTRRARVLAGLEDNIRDSEYVSVNDAYAIGRYVRELRRSNAAARKVGR